MWRVSALKVTSKVEASRKKGQNKTKPTPLEKKPSGKNTSSLYTSRRIQHEQGQIPDPPVPDLSLRSSKVVSSRRAIEARSLVPRILLGLASASHNRPRTCLLTISIHHHDKTTYTSTLFCIACEVKFGVDVDIDMTPLPFFLSSVLRSISVTPRKPRPEA